MSFFRPDLSSCPATTGHLSPLSHDIADYPDGIVLPIDKPYRHFRKKNLKVGHAGTLDPLATGVLLVCIGPACKRAQELQDHDKEYVAGIRVGATTPSYDLEKEVDRTFPYDGVTEESLRAVLPSFLGTQEQVAPLFSAKSVDGVRAYEMARKMYRKAQAGTLDPDFDAAALETLHHSTITISDLELLDFSAGVSEGEGSSASLRDPIRANAPESPSPSERNASSRINVTDTSALGLPEAHIRIACSKGTDIRAFARDLGEALGTGAHLSSLIRTQTGSFRIEHALSLEDALSLLAE